MNWGNPDFLPWLLLLIPAWWLVFRLAARRERLLLRLADAQIIPVLAPRRSVRMARRRTWLWMLAFSLCFAALARPQWGFRWEEVRRRSLDIIVVLDTSRSMLAQDVKPNRLQQAKWGIRDLVQRLGADRVGLVVFAGSSFLECPLTIDYGAFLMSLEDVHVGIIPKGGTAIEQALRTAVAGFDEDTNTDRAIVLITDGEDHEGNPVSLVEEMKRRNIRVYALGVGTLDGDLVPSENGSGGGFLKDRQGHVVKTSLQEGVLERLALDTAGAYVRSTPGDFGLERIFDQGISQLRREETDSKMVRAHEDRYPWFVGAALALFLLEALLAESNNRRKEVAT